MNYRLLKVLLVLAGVVPVSVHAQTNIFGQDGNRNPITVAVPFVSLAPDSRGSAMGDAGVATAPDAYSVHWNNAKLAFIDNDLGFSFSYSPWLGNIVDDMSLNYLTFHKKIDRLQAIGATMRYFDLGEIAKTDILGNNIGIENPRELAVDGTYSRKLSENFSIGVTGRFIWSNLAGEITNSPGAKNGVSVAIDLGAYYTKELLVSGMNSNLSFGAHISNLGQKVSYSTESNEDFIPGNLRLGSAFRTNIDPYNSIMFTVDFNKLLVPTPPIYEVDDNGNPVMNSNGAYVIAQGKDPNRSFFQGTFGSFTDAPRGFSEEMEEIMISAGVEYWYRDIFALRAGYFYENENKGNRKYFTAGLGFRYQVFGVDFSYLVPQEDNHPLGDTLRLSFLFSLDKNQNEPVSN